MVYIFVCFDFDRDYAYPVKNLKHAVSKPIQLKHPKKSFLNPTESVSIQGTAISFDSFMTYLKDKKLPTTFYFEARSAKIFSENYPEKSKAFEHSFFEFGVHGYDHEDFTGEETGLKFTQEEEKKIIEKSKKEIENLFSTRIIGFRAPYMRLSSNTLQIMANLGFKHDSSFYKESENAIQPYKIEKNLVEFPIIKTPKESKMKGMYTYLWPFFEKKRSLEEVVNNYLQLIKNSSNETSYVSINLHSWHFAYNIEQNRFLPKERVDENIQAFVTLISALEKIENVEFSTPGIWLKENKII